MKAKKKESKQLLNKTTIRILYFAVLILLFFLAFKFSVVQEMNPTVEKICGILAGLYILFGLYLDIIYGIPMFNRRVWFGNEEEYQEDFLDWATKVIVFVFTIIMMFSGFD